MNTHNIETNTHMHTGRCNLNHVM